MLVDADVVSIHEWCASTARSFYVWFSRSIFMNCSIPQIIARVRVSFFIYLFIFFFKPDRYRIASWAKRNFSLPLPCPCMLATFTRYIAFTFEELRKPDMQGDGVHLRAACRIFFYPLQTYVRYVSKSPPAPSPSLIQHGTHDCTINADRSTTGCLERNTSIMNGTHLSLHPFSKTLDSSRVLKRADFDEIS